MIPPREIGFMENFIFLLLKAHSNSLQVPGNSKQCARAVVVASTALDRNVTHFIDTLGGGPSPGQ